MDVPQTKVKVEEYMLRHNRPYSVQDILNCYQSSMRKKQCEEALTELVAAKTVTLKEYGKAKIYLINQDRFPEVDQSLLLELDEQISTRRDEFNKLSDQLKEIDKKQKDATNTMTNEQLVVMISKLEIENSQLDTKVTAFKTGGIQLVSEDQIEESLQEQIYYAQNWKKIKRQCRDMMDTISESADLNLKDFIKSLGLETDEDYGVDLNNIKIHS